MNLGIKTLRSVVRIAAFPVFVLGMGLLVCGSPANAQPEPCRNNSRDRDCYSRVATTTTSVPEPSSLVQLGAGLFVLATLGILGRKRLQTEKS
jgi:hypothetical protein